MRIKLLTLIAAIACAMCLPASADADPPQINYEAFVFANLPTEDPCVVNSVGIDVVDFLVPSLASEMSFDVANWNVCSGEFFRTLSMLEAPLVIGESDFVVSHGPVAELKVTLPAFDTVTQSVVPATFDLRWEWTPGRPFGGAAVVTGSVSSGSYVVVLDDSISWNSGVPGEPQAALWRCIFGGGPLDFPACIGQGVGTGKP
jgi:hypothetical protein